MKTKMLMLMVMMGAFGCSQAWAMGKKDKEQTCYQKMTDVIRRQRANSIPQNPTCYQKVTQEIRNLKQRQEKRVNCDDSQRLNTIQNND